MLAEEGGGGEINLQSVAATQLLSSIFQLAYLAAGLLRAFHANGQSRHWLPDIPSECRLHRHSPRGLQLPRVPAPW